MTSEKAMKMAMVFSAISVIFAAISVVARIVAHS